MRHFIFCHGFGFNAKYWDNLRPYFLQEKCTYLDLGYFGPENTVISKENDEILIGVGHSLGFRKLLEQDVHFDYMVGLSAFTDFLGSSKRSIREQELNVFKKNIKRSTALALKSFYKRCGMTVYDQKDVINKEALMLDLESLYTSNNAFAQNCLIIASNNDVVLPKEVVSENFKPPHKLIFLEDGGHALGYLKAPEVYKIVMSYVDGNKFKI